MAVAELSVMAGFPTAKDCFLEPELYRKLYKLDNHCVPQLIDWQMEGLNTVNNGYGMRLVQLRDLRPESSEDVLLLTQVYPTAKSFVSRVLYLLGLLNVSGIVHGTIVPQFSLILIMQ